MTRPRRLAALVLAPLVLAGCLGVPVSGPVTEVQADSLPINAGVRVNPHPPTRGETAANVLDGFLTAMASYEPGYDVAREYLTPEATASWNPRAGVRVYEQGVPAVADGRYLLTAELVGSVDSGGAFRQTSGTLSHDFGLVRDDAGEWRVSTPPDGLIVSRSLFTTAFLRIVSYHHAPGGAWLVPDPRYYPRGPQARDRAAAAIFTGPTSWLAPAVEPAPRVSLVSTQVDPNGVITIRVERPATPLSAGEQERIVTRLAWTFRQFAYVTHLRVVYDDGEPWTLAGSGTDLVPTSSGAEADPVSAQTSRQLFVVAGGRLARTLDTQSGVEQVTVAPGARDLTTAAVRHDGAQAAAVENGRELKLAGVSQPSVRLSLRARSIGRPHYSRQGDVFAPVDGGLRVLTAGTWRSVEVGGAPAGQVTNVRVSPDGVRVAVVVRREDGRASAGIARIERPGGRVRVAAWTELVVRQRDGRPAPVSDVGWSSADEVLAVASLGGGSVVMESNQEGSQQTDLGPAGAAGVAGLAAAPQVAPVIRLGSTETLRYSSTLRWLPHTRGVSEVLYPG